MRLAPVAALVLTGGLAGLVGVSLVGCARDEPPMAEAVPVARTAVAPVSPAVLAAARAVAPDARPVAITVDHKGYLPASIPAKAGERLALVFTRTEDIECAREVKVPGHPVTVLPMNTPTAFAVTLPTDGDLVFTCGMDMFRGVVTLQR